MSDKRRIVRNTMASAVALVTQLASSLVLMPFLIRSFGLADYGLYMLALSVSSYASLLDLGVGSSLVKFVSESRAKHQQCDVEELGSTALGFYIVIGVVAAAGLGVLAFYSAHVFRLDATQTILTRNLFMAAAFVSLLTWPLSTGYHLLGGAQRYDLIARTQLMQTLGVVAVSVLTIASGEGPLVLMVGQSMVNVGAGAVNFVLARRELAHPVISPARASRRVLKRIMSFSWAIFVAQVVAVIVYSQTDRLILGIFLGTAAIGMYEAAGKFQVLISQLVSLVNTSVMPAASQFFAEDRQSMLEALFLRGSKYVCALINPVIVVLIVLARPIIVSWLGARFVPAVQYAQVLLSYLLLTVGTSIGDSMIVGLGKAPKRIPYIVAVAALNLTLSLLLVRRIGILGVVLGSALPWYLEYPSHIWFLLTHIGVSFRKWLSDVVLRTYPLLLVPVALAWAGSRLGLTETLLATAAVAAVAVGSYWGLAYALALKPEERRDVTALLRRISQAVS